MDVGGAGSVVGGVVVGGGGVVIGSRVTGGVVAGGVVVGVGSGASVVGASVGSSVVPVLGVDVGSRSGPPQPSVSRSKEASEPPPRALVV